MRCGRSENGARQRLDRYADRALLALVPQWIARRRGRHHSRMLTAELDTPYELADDAVERFRHDGFVHLHDVLSAETLQRYGKEINAKVVELNTMHLPLEERSTYDKAFLQVTNIWTHSEVARKLVFSRRLAQIATELLGTKGVRLYHD
jgi:hypothetical protein